MCHNFWQFTQKAERCNNFFGLTSNWVLLTQVFLQSVCPVEISDLYYEQDSLIENTNEHIMIEDNGAERSDRGVESSVESSDESESICLSGIEELEGD